MFFVGGKLKARGNLTGRYADVVAWLYITTSALRRYEAEGRKAEDLALVQYAGEYGLTQIQKAFEGIYENFDGPVGVILKTVADSGWASTRWPNCPTISSATRQRWRCKAMASSTSVWWAVTTCRKKAIRGWAVCSRPSA